MKLEEMIDEELYVLVAPDGTPQLMTLTPDYPMCLAVVNMMAQSGMGQTPKKLFEQGYHVLQVKITITQIGDEHTAFNKARAEL